MFRLYLLTVKEEGVGGDAGNGDGHAVGGLHPIWKASSGKVREILTRWTGVRMGCTFPYEIQIECLEWHGFMSVCERVGRCDVGGRAAIYLGMKPA
jgi:hypothetical protein